MAVTVDDLAKQLGFVATPADTEQLQRVLDASVAAIAPHIIVEDYVDHPMYELALLTVAADFWRQKDAPRGIYGMAEGSEFYPGSTIPRSLLPIVWPWLANAGLASAAVVA